MNDEQIFLKAIEISSSHDRMAFVEEACGDDAELKHKVLRLLEAHDEQDFLHDNPAVLQETSDFSIADKTLARGQKIGEYKLLSELGHVGMGVVYMT